MPIPEEVLEGVRLFNAGEFFEAHEAWEDHWGKGAPDERGATLGLIKAAVALHHLGNQNAAGFAWQVEEALPRLRACAHVWPELRLTDLAEQLESTAAQWRFHGRLPEGWKAPHLPSPDGPS